MKFQFRHGAPEDVPGFVEIVVPAFSTNPIHSRVFPEGDITLDFWTSSLAEEIQDPKARFIVIEDVDTNTPTLVAFAKWNVVPEGVLPDEPPPPDSFWPKEGDVELGIQFFGDLLRMHQGFMTTEPHWYLELIATRSKYQGKGAASKLVQWGTDEADKAGQKCYLDATPDGRGLYIKYGFSEVHRLSYLDKTYEQCAMIREAKK